MHHSFSIRALIGSVGGTLIALSSLFFLPACTGKGGQTPQTGAQTAPAPQGTQAQGLRIAVVDLDSLYAHYQYHKDLTATLEAKANQNEATLRNKAAALQKGMQAFDQKLRSGGFVNETAAQAEQERLLKLQQEGASLESSLTNQFMKETEEANNKLYQTIREEMEKFNTPKKYDLILTTVGIQNVLYRDSVLDITNQVAEFLNKAYQESKDAKPAEKKKN